MTVTCGVRDGSGGPIFPNQKKAKPEEGEAFPCKFQGNNPLVAGNVMKFRPAILIYASMSIIEFVYMFLSLI